MRLVRSFSGRALSAVLLAGLCGCGHQGGAEAWSEDDLTAEEPVRRVDFSQSERLAQPAMAAAVAHDTSAPLTLLPVPAAQPDQSEHEMKRLPPLRRAQKLAPEDPLVLQASRPALSMPSLSTSFEGEGKGFTGPQGGFSIIGVPPDTNGDVGPNHYVQTVNSHLSVFSKSGAVLYGPVAINTLFAGMGGFCEQHNDGDPVVLYDALADRWVISQFAITIPNPLGGSTGNAEYHQCVAVSATPDPTGAYHRYDYQFDKLNDYPKLGVWPDAYYATFNMFDMANGGGTFAGAKLCAFDRAAMLSGAPASQQCFQLANTIGGVLPADHDGTMPPPVGAPGRFAAMNDEQSLAVWSLKVDWKNPANTALSGPVVVPVAPFKIACDDGKENTCIHQPITSQQLDALSDRLMFRLAYRNFGDHESLTVNHAVAAGSSTGVRWYELRLDNAGNPTLYQQGTYAPDGDYRWLGSVAMDAVGNMAMGFSVAGDSTNPSIAYTGRLANDALGLMTQGEAGLMSGSAPQLPQYLLLPISRWGDYSMMSIDPTDDCTFWFTSEYIGSWSLGPAWQTRIGSFKFPGCAVKPPPPAVDVIKNGGFEGSLQSWKLGGAKLPIMSTVNAHTGKNSMRCGATPKVQPNGDSFGYQSLTIPATATKATLGFWYYASATGAQAWQQAAVRDPGGKVVIDIFHGQDNSQRWTYKEVDLAGLIGKNVQIYFDAHGAKGQPATLFVDDVSLKVQ